MYDYYKSCSHTVLRTSSLEIQKDVVTMHSSSQTRVKEDDQSRQEQCRQKQWAFRKTETCRERSNSDNVVAEHPKLIHVSGGMVQLKDKAIENYSYSSYFPFPR